MGPMSSIIPGAPGHANQMHGITWFCATYIMLLSEWGVCTPFSQSDGFANQVIAWLISNYLCAFHS
jgi:hypothetical protein